MPDIFLLCLSQLLAQSPVLLVYLVGLILSLVFWRRCQIPCLLTLSATSLLLLLALTHTFVSTYLSLARTEMGWTTAKLTYMLSVMALAATCLRAAALSLLLAGVFVGRRVFVPAGPNELGAANRNQPVRSES